jgi:hypothetical protein
MVVRAGVCGRSGDVRALGVLVLPQPGLALPSLLYAVPLRVKVNFEFNDLSDLVVYGTADCRGNMGCVR